MTTTDFQTIAGSSQAGVADRPARADARGPLTYRDDNFLICARGRFRIGDHPVNDGADLKRMVEEICINGHDFPRRLTGSFSIVIVDISNATSYLAVDRMGIETLCWSLSKDALHFGSRADWVAASADKTEINWQSIYDYLFAHVVPGPDTAFQGVSRLPAATSLTLKSAVVREHRYWTPSFDRSSARTISELHDATLPELRAATQRVLSAKDTTGSFLSGGLDSSTLTGLLHEVSEGRSQAFSVGFGVDAYNELEFARAASKHFGCEHLEYVLTPDDIVDLAPEIARAFDGPFGNSSAVPTLACAKFARQNGVSVMIAGDGGDELFAGNERYLKQRAFQIFHKVPAFLRSSIFEPAAFRIDPESAVLPLRKFSSYVRQARLTLPERFETWNFMYRQDPRRVFDEDFLSSVDQQHALRRMEEVWNSSPSDDLLDQMLWYDWKHTLADNDLPKVTQTCRAAGIDVTFPFLDERVVSLSTEIPTREKIKAGNLRHFFKQVTESYLPEKIIGKTKHGFGLPFGTWLKEDERLQGFIYDRLENLKGRALLQREFIDNVIAQHRGGHDAYYGYIIWDLAMLEEWLALQSAGGRADEPGAVGV